MATQTVKQGFYTQQEEEIYAGVNLGDIIEAKRKQGERMAYCSKQKCLWLNKMNKMHDAYKLLIAQRKVELGATVGASPNPMTGKPYSMDLIEALVISSEEYQTVIKEYNTASTKYQQYSDMLTKVESDDTFINGFRDIAKEDYKRGR